MNKQHFFLIDFIKFALVFGMMFRHAPLYLYDGQLIEYGLNHITPFSFFIPVTAGFIFVLGYTLNLNKSSYSLTKVRKSLIFGFKLLLISCVMALITFHMKNIAISFPQYYFLYEWNTLYKPGFYILFPISVFYLINAIIKLRTYESQLYFINIGLVITLLISLYTHLYFFHYIFFGFLGAFLARLNNFNDLFYKFCNQKLSILVAIFVYLSAFNYFNTATLWIEVLLLLSFCIIMGCISLLIKFNNIQKLISFISSEILMFYLAHVIILNIIGKYLSFSNWYSMSLFSILGVFLMCPIILLIRKIIHKGIL